MKAILVEELEGAMTRALVAAWKEIDAIESERATKRRCAETERALATAEFTLSKNNWRGQVG